jgi:hypothetical protein
MGSVSASPASSASSWLGSSPSSVVAVVALAALPLRVGLLLVAAATAAAVLLVAALLLGHLRLLGGVHRAQDAEIMLGVLEVALGGHAVAGAGRVAAELEVLLEQLLRGAAQAHVGPAAVEGVVAVERLVAAAVVAAAGGPELPAAAAPAAMAWATAHALHVHSLSCFCQLDRRHCLPRKPVSRAVFAPPIPATGPDGPSARLMAVRT